MLRLAKLPIETLERLVVVRYEPGSRCSVLAVRSAGGCQLDMYTANNQKGSAATMVLNTGFTGMHKFQDWMKGF